MSFLELYSLKGLKRILKTSTDKIDALTNRLDSALRIMVNTNLNNQEVVQKRITQAPSHIENVMRLYDVQFVRIINHEASSPKNSDLIFTMRQNEIQVNKSYELVGVCAIDGKDLTITNKLFMSSNANYDHRMSDATFSLNNDGSQNVKLMMRFQAGKFYMRWTGSYTGQMTRITLYAKEIPTVVRS